MFYLSAICSQCQHVPAGVESTILDGEVSTGTLPPLLEKKDPWYQLCRCLTERCLTEKVGAAAVLTSVHRGSGLLLPLMMHQTIWKGNALLLLLLLLICKKCQVPSAAKLSIVFITKDAAVGSLNWQDHLCRSATSYSYSLLYCLLLLVLLLLLLLLKVAFGDCSCLTAWST